MREFLINYVLVVGALVLTGGALLIISMLIEIVRDREVSR